MFAIATNWAKILYTDFMGISSDGSKAVDVKWLDDREMRAWRGYIETIGDLQNALEGDLTDVGLTVGDYQVLVYLSEQENERMRMCDLADLLHLSPSGLTRRLDGLVRMGAVAREPCPEDRRATLAALTPSGRRLLENVAPQHVMSVRKHFIDALTPRQIEVLGDVFEALRRHFSAETTG
jgi:DNA-binding MarR family transcriptional regulator